MATPTTIKTEGGFPYPMYNPRSRPEFRRPFSDGSMAIPTSELQFAASLPTAPSFLSSFPYDQHQSFFQPFDYNMDLIPTMSMAMPISVPAAPPTPLTDDRSRSLSRGSIGKAKTARSRSGRKGSMTDVKPTVGRVRTASSRAMSYSHPDGRPGLGLDTHVEHQRTNSVSPPDYAYGLAGVAAPHSWGSGSLQSMQSFGTTIDEAVLDSPISPSSHLPPLPPDASEESRKQRRRECHNLVEKRRREHINNKIDELAGLLPPQYQQADELAMEQDEEEEVAESPKTKKKSRRNSSVAKQKELGACKGRILTHSVQYIHDLRQVNTLQANRIQQLEALLAAGESFTAPPSLVQTHSNSLFEPSGLEPLRPSPEPEAFGQDWNNFNPVFEESPDSFDTSSGSAEPISQNLSQSHGHGRHDSQSGLRMGMSGMELDAVFAGGRRDDDMPIRW